MEHSNEDAYLLIALRKGEVIAFDSIFKKYYPILCAYGNRFVDNEESKEIDELVSYTYHDNGQRS